ncbi:MAG: HAD family hydrolase [Thalassobaculum sp.]|uniref:HAD family hydrolase n=1 Tax=Thalassobaculum sp. TaxID=2022740 RepID=UPI0032EF0F86
MTAGIRGIVFDKDGTLIHFEETWTPAYVESAEALAGQLGRPELAATWLHATGLDPATGRVLPGTLLASATVDVIAAEWHALSPELPALDGLIPWLDEFWERRALELLAPVGDLPGLFDRLRGDGLRLGVATNDSAQAAHATVTRLGLAERVDFVAGYDSGHGAKPGPGMILAFCAAMGLAPGQVAMVGDSPADLAAGRAAGCGRVVGVLTGTSPATVLAPLADVVVADVHALPGML